MTINRRTILTGAAGAVIAAGALGEAGAAVPRRWTANESAYWHQRQPYLVGCNFVPSTAVNQLEMFQAATFDPATIDRELGWTAGIGMNTVRVFLHNLLWQEDAQGFKSRLDQFLAIAARHGIRPMLVLFDSVWNPYPHAGPQPAPRPGIHNSQWVQAPGITVLENPSLYPALEEYVLGIVGAFANDPRILAWDVWNEPDNMNGNSYGWQEPSNKVALVTALLPYVFAWARLAGPTQPLTSAVWQGDWSSPSKLNQIQTIQLGNSDIITFHNYGFVEDFVTRIGWLLSYGRPVLCSEYLARDVISLFEEILPAAYRYNVGAINWGCVAGKTQTIITWDSWQHPYTDASAYGGTNFQDVVLDASGAVVAKPVRPYSGEAPPVWHHDIFYPDGTPYRKLEIDVIKKIARQSR